MNPFKISLALLERQKKIRLEGELPQSFLDMPDTELMKFTTPVKYDIEVSSTTGGTVVRGGINTAAECVCGRCLKRFTMELEGEVCHFYDKTDDQELDMSEDIREDIVLEAPMNPVCSEDCRGLCLKCGADLNKKTCKCDQGGGGNLAWSELDKLDL